MKKISLHNKNLDDPLSELRRQVKALIRDRYRSVDEFCLLEGFHKSTLSRFLNPTQGKGRPRTEYQIQTLSRMARALEKKLVIRLK